MAEHGANGQVEKLVIVGSGPAGLTAGIYAARAALNPLLFEGFSAGGIPGGQLMYTTEVENYPGFPEGVLGPEMMGKFREQAQRHGTRLIGEDVTAVDFTQRPFTIKSDERTVRAHAVIVSTGAVANWLGLPREDELKSKGGGVSACAVCDGALPAFRGQKLIVVGGGDSAIEEASYLTKYAESVTIVHRRDKLRASMAMQQRATSNPKIKFAWNTVLTSYVTEVNAHGHEQVVAVTTQDLVTGATGRLEARGVFMGIGHTPNTQLFQGQLALHDNGYLKVEPGSTRTSVAGVFAAGDVADFTYRQAVTAAGTGCMAALDAERWLAEHE